MLLLILMKSVSKGSLLLAYLCGIKNQIEKELGKKIISLWKNKNDKNKPYVVFTGGEPLLQLDKRLINFLKLSNFEVGIETNGTIDLPCKIDWVCVSPKDENDFVLKKGDELKLIFPIIIFVKVLLKVQKILANRVYRIMIVILVYVV